MEFLQSNKEALCKLLSEHLKKVMDHVEDMVTGREYRIINDQGGRKGIESLLGIMLKKEEDDCQKFVTFLRENFPEVQKFADREASTASKLYADQGSTIVASETANVTMNSYKMEVNVDGHQGGNHSPSQVCPQPAVPSSGSRMVATNNSHIFAPKLTGSTVKQDVCFSFNFNAGAKNAGTLHSQISGATTGKGPQPTISDKLGFFRNHYSDLTQKVKNVQPILDVLIQKGFHKEMAANVRAENTSQRQMREILDGTTSKTAAEALFEALLTNEKDLMTELMSPDT
ncbi:uncharacterized protein LOC143100818 [Alosa pseudoharengus]|uniref:uncharacterized protein LOC143100818 n=1 Tax=Alosa pseudoharengus TaxID=34774 RepID=UPI003F8B5DAA